MTVKGPKGELTQKVNKDIKVEQVGSEIHVTRPSDSKPHRSMHGLYRALINNMVVGVTKGFEKVLLIEGVGYPRAASKAEKLNLERWAIPIRSSWTRPNTSPSRLPQPRSIVIKGIDKQAVGAIAADVRAMRKPEPYHGKGIRYEDEVHPPQGRQDR